MTAELLNVDPWDITKADTKELRAQLARGLTLVAENLFRTGQIWVELERRGEDLSDLRRGLNIYLPLIGAGRVDARAVVRFAGSPALLRAVSLLPIDDQVRLAMGGTVPLITDGAAVAATDPLRLTVPQIGQVFASGQIRSTAEQREIVGRRTRRAVKKPAVQYDRERRRFLVGKVVVPFAQIVGAMAASSESKGRREKTVKIEVQLPEAILLDLKVGSTENGKDFSEALIAAMRLAGMI